MSVQAIQSDKNVWQVLSQYRRLYGILPFKGQAKAPRAPGAGGGGAGAGGSGNTDSTDSADGTDGMDGTAAVAPVVTMHGRDPLKRVRKYDTHNDVQVVFAGATIPGNGTESVLAKVRTCSWPWRS